jgi:hypothetical protein
MHRPVVLQTFFCLDPIWPLYILNLPFPTPVSGSKVSTEDVLAGQSWLALLSEPTESEKPSLLLRMSDVLPNAVLQISMLGTDSTNDSK